MDFARNFWVQALILIFIFAGTSSRIVSLFAKLCKRVLELKEVAVLRSFKIIVLPVVDISKLMLQLISKILDLRLK